MRHTWARGRNHNSGDRVRALPLIGVTFATVIALASCSSTSTDSSSAASSSCSSRTQSWLHGQGGADFRVALSAASAARSAIARGDRALLETSADRMNDAALLATRNVPPTCSDPGDSYRLGMDDWRSGAADGKGDEATSAAAQISKGANKIALVAVLKASVHPVTALVRVHVAPAPKAASPTPAPPVATTPPPAPVTPAATTPPPAPTTPAAVPSAPATTQASCSPISDEGTCYEPGEYCRDDDHGMSGIAGDGEAIVCEDNDGWRWEPA